MKKIVASYYLFLTLVLVAQAFFTVVLNNQQIDQNSQVQALERQKVELAKEMADLENQIAANQSILANKNLAMTEGWHDLTNKKVVAAKETTQILSQAVVDR